jgi:hypothetical protein
MLKWLFILITIKINDFLSWKQLEVAVECHCLELTHKGKDKLNNKEMETFPKPYQNVLLRSEKSTDFNILKQVIILLSTSLFFREWVQQAKVSSECQLWK